MTEEKARTALIASAAVSAVGIAIAATLDRALGGVVVVGGWIGLVYALHAFGRAEAP